MAPNRPDPPRDSPRTTPIPPGISLVAVNPARPSLTRPNLTRSDPLGQSIFRVELSLAALARPTSSKAHPKWVQSSLAPLGPFHPKHAQELHKLLPKLKYVGLMANLMIEDLMPVLGKLPNLTFLELQLRDVYRLACTAGGFPQLQFLRIVRGRVKELQVEEGGLPLLKGLTVNGSIRMPERLRSIPAVPGLD
ncbi:hypothetical protein Acr_10g0001400 [Actinidia rufa]|uniref:Uncharacterized protein n=1 Tax=Actinidia rufa TaxID=165716 RepID=A0A7J0F7T1_9ERIC|nr:hypothetical protein Acr_10g0001400 [Actinidia rufa]